MLVRGVVVGNQVQRLVLPGFAVDLMQKLQPFIVPVALLTLANHRAIQDIVCCKERRGAMALGVGRHRRGVTLFQGQSRLRAIERLRPALLVAGERQDVLWRIQIQSHDIRQFLDKQRIVRDSESLNPVRFEAVCVPCMPHGAAAHAGSLGQGACAPVGGVWSRGFE